MSAGLFFSSMGRGEAMEPNWPIVPPWLGTRSPATRSRVARLGLLLA